MGAATAQGHKRRDDVGLGLGGCSHSPGAQTQGWCEVGSGWVQPQPRGTNAGMM